MNFGAPAQPRYGALIIRTTTKQHGDYFEWQESSVRKTRRHLFGESTSFAKKVVLTRRVRWIEGSTGAPSFNHAWFCWDRSHSGPPSIAYA